MTARSRRSCGPTAPAATTTGRPSRGSPSSGSRRSGVAATERVIRSCRAMPRPRGSCSGSGAPPPTTCRRRTSRSSRPRTSRPSRPGSPPALPAPPPTRRSSKRSPCRRSRPTKARSPSPPSPARSTAGGWPWPVAERSRSSPSRTAGPQTAPPPCSPTCRAASRPCISAVTAGGSSSPRESWASGESPRSATRPPERCSSRSAITATFCTTPNCRPTSRRSPPPATTGRSSSGRWPTGRSCGRWTSTTAPSTTSPGIPRESSSARRAPTRP